MKFSERLLTILRQKNQKRGWQTAFAQRAGVPQSVLSKIIKGESKDPSLSTVSAIIEALEEEGEERFSLLSKNRENEIPVYAMTGAGPVILPDQLEPLFTVITPPEHFQRSNYAILVKGHSMEPRIPDGAIVGIKTDEDFQANHLFLADIPYEGLVVKRVGVDMKNEEFIFKSDNPDKAAYPDFRLSIHEAEKIILGKVVWVMVGY